VRRRIPADDSRRMPNRKESRDSRMDSTLRSIARFCLAGRSRDLLIRMPLQAVSFVTRPGRYSSENETAQSGALEWRRGPAARCDSVRRLRSKRAPAAKTAARSPRSSLGGPNRFRGTASWKVVPGGEFSGRHRAIGLRELRCSPSLRAGSSAGSDARAEHEPGT
jgi:hypothetical protein